MIRKEYLDFNHMKDKDKRMDWYLRHYSPFRKREPLNFDLRGYAAYINEHGLKAGEITEEIMNMFLSSPKDRGLDTDKHDETELKRVTDDNNV